MNEDNIEVTIEVKTETGTVSSKFTGSAEEVIRGVMNFLSESFPAFSIARKISLRYPSTDELVNLLSEDVKISGKEIFFLKKPTDTAEGIKKALIAARVAYELGATDSNAISVKELARITSIAEKTINNNLTELVKSGAVERVSKGVYKITDRGLLEVTASSRIDEK